MSDADADADLLDALRDDYESELSRLASSKALYALTGGEMDAGTIRAAVVADAAAAASTFEAWTGDVDGAEGAAAAGVADLFARAAETAAATRAAAAEGAADAADVTPYPIYDALRDAEGTPARVGGLLARSLLAGETVGQVVGFFVGDADPTAADAFRGRRREVEAVRDDAAATLPEVCADDADREAAEAAARAVIETAYEAYVDRLEARGIKPKNVC
jgi:hypothetical protein